MFTSYFNENKCDRASLLSLFDNVYSTKHTSYFNENKCDRASLLSLFDNVYSTKHKVFGVSFALIKGELRFGKKNFFVSLYIRGQCMYSLEKKEFTKNI